MLLKYVLAFALFISSSAITYTKADQNDVDSNEQTVWLEPEKEHAHVSRLIAGFLAQYHYRKVPLNDVLSEEIFDSYIKLLDPSRSYLLQSDIESFEHYRYQLDDALKTGNLKSAYFMFNRLMMRWFERYDYALSLLDKEFTYDTEEFYRYDRTDAAWPKTTKEVNDIWYKRVKNDALNLKLAGKEWTDIKDLLTKRYEAAKRYMSQSRSEDVFRRFMNAYSQSLEPHTNYLSPRNAEQFDIYMKLSFEGIGAVLQSEDVYTKVVRLMPAGPAEKSNQIKSGDKIIGVGEGKDGDIVDVIGWRLDDVVDLIRGPKNSIVRLQLLPAEMEADGKTKIVSLTREQIKIEEQAAKSKIETITLGDEIIKLGVIELPKFYIDFDARYRGEKNYRSTTRDVKKLLKEMMQEDIQGVLIDLRNNGGGALLEATQLTGLFIDEGPVVQERNAKGRVTVLYDDDPEVIYTGPLMVLVNRFSASASEIFAGAIQDYGRGIVVGENTFGKGTVQRLLDLNRLSDFSDKTLGQIKYTTSKFYRINGGSTQHRGVIPDIDLPSMIDHATFGESAEDNALPWDQITPTEFSDFPSLTELVPTLVAKHKQRVVKDSEYQYLLRDISDFEQKRNRKEISLNETARLTERKINDQKLLDRENQRRAAQGLALIKSLEEIESKESDVQPDPILNESLNILADMVKLLPASELISSNKTKPDADA